MKESSISIDINYLHYQEIRIVGTIAQSKEDLIQAIEFVEKNINELDFLNTEIVPFERAEEAFCQAIKSSINRIYIKF